MNGAETGKSEEKDELQRQSTTKLNSISFLMEEMEKSISVLDIKTKPFRLDVVEELKVSKDKEAESLCRLAEQLGYIESFLEHRNRDIQKISDEIEINT